MKVDMSPEAIARRLNELNEVWNLCMVLSKARIVSSARKKEKKKSLAKSKDDAGGVKCL